MTYPNHSFLLTFSYLLLLFTFVTQLVLLSAFSVVSTATYSYQRPHRSPRLRALADASNIQTNLILLVLLLVRNGTAHKAENTVGNVMYSIDTKFLNELCYGKYGTFSTCISLPFTHLLFLLFIAQYSSALPTLS